MNPFVVKIIVIYALEIHNNSDYYIRNKFLTNKIFEYKNKISYNSNDYDLQEEQESEINELEIYKCNV